MPFAARRILATDEQTEQGRKRKVLRCVVWNGEEVVEVGPTICSESKIGEKLDSEQPVRD